MIHPTKHKDDIFTGLSCKIVNEVPRYYLYYKKGGKVKVNMIQFTTALTDVVIYERLRLRKREVQK